MGQVHNRTAKQEDTLPPANVHIHPSELGRSATANLPSGSLQSRQAQALQGVGQGAHWPAPQHASNLIPGWENQTNPEHMQGRGGNSWFAQYLAQQSGGVYRSGLPTPPTAELGTATAGIFHPTNRYASGDPRMPQSSQPSWPSPSNQSHSNIQRR